MAFGARHPLALAASLLLVALVAAGGAAPARAASACEQWDDAAPASLSSPQARAAVLCVVNRRRDRAGLPALKRDRRLQKAAQRHNGRMHGSGCFSHQCAGEGSLETRLRSTGYLRGGLSRWAYGENIAWGNGAKGTPRAVVAAWMSSSGHRANILSRSFREIGVGFDVGSPSRKRARGGIYTVDFGLAAG